LTGLELEKAEDKTFVGKIDKVSIFSVACHVE